MADWVDHFLWHSNRYFSLLLRCKAILRKAGIPEQYIGDDLETIEAQAGLTGKEFAEQADFEAALSAWALNRAHELAAAPGAAPAAEAEPEQAEPEARAILFVKKHVKETGKLPPKVAIAKLLDVDRRTLNNWTGFRVAYKKMKADLSRRRPPPKGQKSADGNVEAWRD